MRAVWYERNGPARDVLIIGEQPTPQPGPGEVRVALHASGVNPADCNRRRGEGYAMEWPIVIPHSDGAGVIDAVGTGVPDARIGERIWLYNGQRNGRNLGTAAEFICLDAGLVTRLPDDVPFAAGACLGIPCMTAHRSVFTFGPVQGKNVLVTGGAGAVGHYAVQLAKWGGARVIATASNDAHRADARAAGADIILNRHTDDVRSAILDATEGRGVDLAVEVDFGGNLPILADVIAVNGGITTYASRGNATPQLPFYALMRRNVTLHTLLLPTLPLAVRQQAQTDITRWLSEGPRLHRVVGPYPLDQVATAHEAVEAGGKRGTVVVEPAA